MNILKEVSSSDNNSVPEAINPVWLRSINAAKKQASTSVRGIARVADREFVRVPVNSVTTVPAVGWNGQASCNLVIVELIENQHSPNLITVNTLVHPKAAPFHVRVANFTDEDICLQPRTIIGVLHAVGGLETNVGFHRVSVNEELVVREDTSNLQYSTEEVKCLVVRSRS